MRVASARGRARRRYAVAVEFLETGAAELAARHLEVAHETRVLPAHPLGVDEEPEARSSKARPA